jgi:hypothetical protein
VSPGLEDGAELAEVLAVGVPDGGGYQGCREPGEPGWFAAVPQGHPGRAVTGRLPGVGGFHRERPLGGAHDEPLGRDEAGDLVGVGELPAEEALNVSLDPACNGGLVSQVTEVMFWYQAGTFEGSAA